MVTHLFTIQDTKAQLFSAPFLSQTKGSAIRAFLDHANDKNSAIGKHPEDYCLCLIGTWNDLTAEIQTCRLENIGSAQSLMG